MNPDLPLGKLPAAPVIPSHQPSKMTMPELEEREQIIKKGKETFVKVGLALLEIREGRGYKLRGFATFEEYIQNQFDFSRRRGYQLMEAAQVVVDLKECEPVVHIESERQARDIKEIGTEKVIEQLKPAMSAPNPVEAVKSAVRDIVHKHREEKRSEPDLTPRRVPLGDLSPDAAVSSSDDEVFDATVANAPKLQVDESPHLPCPVCGTPLYFDRKVRIVKFVGRAR